MFKLGLAIFLFTVIIGTVTLGGHVTHIIDLASMLMFVLPLFAVLLATGSLRTFIDGLRAVLNPREPCTEELRGQAASLFRFLSRITAMLSGLWVLIPLMTIGFGIDLSYIGLIGELIGALAVNFAAILIAPVYGLILITAIFEPAVFILKKRRAI